MEYTEEEKKDIEMCNIFVNQNAMISYLGCDEKGNLIFPQCDAKPIQTLLNLIEKQQKEIKELKEHLNQYYDGKLFTANQLKAIEKEHNKYYIHKDKIREKIEEYAGLKEIDIKAYDEQIRPLKEILGE